MDDHNLWKKLHSAHTREEGLALHRAGATIRHKNPFEHLEVPRNENPLTQEFINRWVIPFYMLSFPSKDEQKKNYAKAAKQIDPFIISALIGDFDWRSRITAAYFIAINQYITFEDIIGRMLLKSEVCYAGSAYCLVLAEFGTITAKNYLAEYLDYYLQRSDLWFDQADAFCALEYIDPSAVQPFQAKWNEFVADKPNWNLESSRKHFSDQMELIKEIRLL
jgi:hypothetical protein